MAIAVSLSVRCSEAGIIIKEYNTNWLGQKSGFP